MKIDTSKFANFEIKEVQIGETYQYKEGSEIFNFKLTSFINDGQYLYIVGEVSDKVKEYYKMDKLILQLSVEPFYYSGMVKIMKKDSYLNNLDDNWQK